MHFFCFFLSEQRLYSTLHFECIYFSPYLNTGKHSRDVKNTPAASLFTCGFNPYATVSMIQSMNYYVPHTMNQILPQKLALQTIKNFETMKNGHIPKRSLGTKARPSPAKCMQVTRTTTTFELHHCLFNVQ